jgi:hypothetical protein
MKKNLKKIHNLFILSIFAFFLFGYTQTVFAQTTSNFGSVVEFANKKVIENPANVIADPTLISGSSCPDGSVLVGFNLYNQGENYSKYGSLYCRSVEINFGSAFIYVRSLIENPFNGGANSTQIQESSCPAGFVAVGFNILNAGSNTSNEGNLYCKQILSAKVSPTGQNQTASIGQSSPVRKEVIENPFGSGGDQNQIAASSCPNGYVVTGFNLINMGENYSKSNDLYCSNLTFTQSDLDFDFSLSNNGHRYIKPGDTVSNSLYTNAIVSDVSGDIKLTIDSIKNGNGVSVMNTTNGFTVSTNPFNPKTNIVTLSPSIKQVTTPLSFVANNSILPDTYTVNISGVYSKTVAGTSGSTTNYYCKIEFETDNSKYYFGCSTDSGFSSKNYFINFGGGANPPAIECINNDAFGPGEDAICFSDKKVLSIFAKEQIRDFRTSYGDSVCDGSVNVPDDPNDNLDGPDNPNTGFTCVIDSVAPVTQTIKKTTTFDVIVEAPESTINYLLSVTPSPNGCPASSLFVTNTWKSITNATSYNLYRYETTALALLHSSGIYNGAPVQTFSVNTSPVNGYVSFNDNTFTKYNILAGYAVAAVVNGVELKKSNIVWTYTPQLTSNCTPQPNPLIKLFTKKTNDPAINLNLLDINSAITTANTEISIYRSDAFDLKWVSNLGANYTCNQSTVLPNGATNNTRIVYGNTINGTSVGIGGSNLDIGLNQLKVSCSNGSTVLSNVVKITILPDPIAYKLSITPSGDQCLSADVWIKQTWSAVPNATSYKITRTGGAGPVTYNIPSSSTQNVEPMSSFSAVPTQYTYIISAIVGGVEQAASAPITITSPKVDCPTGPPSIKLFTRNSTDFSTNLSGYTLSTTLVSKNSDIVVIKGKEFFDLKWISNLDNGYVCNQITTTPAGVTNNTLWDYGSYPNGIVYDQETINMATGVYGFRVSCTKSGTTILSNVVNVNIMDPTNYNLIVSPSANQCDINSLQIQLTWSSVPGATNYRISRTDVGTGQVISYTVSGVSFTQSFANGTVAFKQDADYSYKVVALASGVAIAPSSPTVTVRSPKQDSTLCSTMSLKLEVKKSTDLQALYGSSVILNKGENFDLRWTIINPNGTTYMNSNYVIGPQGMNANGLWTWGSGTSGSRTGLSTTPQAVVAGDYTFKIEMTDVSTGNYVLALSSNSVKVTVNSVTDVCPNLPGIQTVVPDSMIKNSSGNCVFGGGGGGGGSDPNIKLFIGDTSVKAFDLSSPIPTSPYPRIKGQEFTLSWVSNLSSGFECQPQTTSTNISKVTIWDWNQSNLTTGDNVLQTVSATPDTYNFQLYCVDPVNSPNQVRRGNVAQMSLSDIATDPSSIKLFIGGANILSNTLATPLNPNPTFKVKKGNRFNLLWASNLNSSYECIANTKKSDGTDFLTWDWNSTKSKGDKAQNLTTSNVEKGIYSFQLFCSDPAHDPANPDKQSNIVKLQIVESTIVEQ